MQVKECSYILLIPVIGAITYKDSTGNQNLVEAGQVQLSSADKGLTIEISNPFKSHAVNFL